MHAASTHSPAPPQDGFQASHEMAEFALLSGASACPVLLYGETGSGKTHLARLIHQASPRAKMPFVRVNCGSIPESLFEREMFGHVRGAFTDAGSGGSGFLEAAHDGTLFLDELGELPLAVQSKLLAVLEDGRLRRLGSPRETTVNVRVVAATHRDLAAMVRARTFRQDLFYRISVIQYKVAPLRERQSELPALVRQVLGRVAEPHVRVSDAAMALLATHPWPGNIRELENALRAGVVFSRGTTIEPKHLPEEVRAPAQGPGRERYAACAHPGEEDDRIRRAITDSNGNKAEAARRLGMSRSTLWAKLHRYAG